MKIHSLKLTNYRIHREFAADFDPSRTLVGGPNESGKSTLADAAYNALFMRAKKGGAKQKKILSRHGGHPEVELRFESSGRTYSLRKSFRGPQGTIVLSKDGGDTWNGDGAEEKLLELCGIGVGEIGGQTIPTHWEHLWVRQGEAGADPSAFATEKKDTLLSQLQGSGAAAVFQSALDSRVAGQVALELAGIQTARGPKVGSEWDNATRAFSAATQVHQSAKNTCVSLEQAAADFDQSTQELVDADRNLIGFQAELSEVHQKLGRVGELRSLLDRQRTEATHKTEEFQRLAAGDESIKDITSHIDLEAKALAPREDSLKLAKEAEATAKIAHTEAEKANVDASLRSRDARVRLDLAELCVKRFEQTNLVAKLQKRATDVQALRAQLAHLPAVTSDQVTNLQKLDRDREKLASALAAISTRIEIIAADLPVVADGHPLESGQPLEFSHDTEILIGSGVRLRITPGGGTSLAKTRNNLAEAETAFQGELTALGLSSLAEATAAKTKRDEILVRLEGTDSIEQELADAQSRLATTEEEIRRRSEACPDFIPAADATAATDLQAAGLTKNEEAAHSEKAAAESLKTCFKQFEAATKTVASHREDAQNAKSTLEGLKGQLVQLLSTHGDEASRKAKLADLANVKRLAETEFKTTEESFNALQPQVLEADQIRLSRAISGRQNTKITAGERLAVAKNTLRREGTSDPWADLARAVAAERSAGDRLASAKRHAEAIVLLNSLFSAEQQSLTDQLTKPLADKVSGYLQCLFGPKAEAIVKMTDGAFEALTLSRPDAGTFSFSELSGGAQEQTAIAFRLAMAEILAQEHGNCLPVFLDDAFTNSDPTRVALLQRMLDLAAARGLQIIVFSCTPNDYASLGAKIVMLQPPATLPAAAAEASPPVDRIEDQPSPKADVSGDGAVVDVTEDMKQKFLEHLTTSSEGRMGNGSLRDALGWDEPTYNAVKDHLLASSRIVPGRGRGGSVGLAER